MTKILETTAGQATIVADCYDGYKVTVTTEVTGKLETYKCDFVNPLEADLWALTQLRLIAKDAMKD